jgi:hypothetical protein
MERELTGDETGLVATAIRYGPFPPKPKYLPGCHRLHERAWFDVGVPDDRVVFSLSTAGVTALRIPLADAREATN